MSQFGGWLVESGKPVPMTASHPEVEEHLEGWIAEDPNLLRQGLSIVCRQFPTAAGPIDILAVDISSHWVVVELKRDQTDRDTVAQALDYAAALAQMSFDEVAEAATSRRAKEKREPVSCSEYISGLGIDSEALADGLGEPQILVVGTRADTSFGRLLDYLQSYQLPIQGISFGYFERDQTKVLVRQVESQDSGSLRRGRISGQTLDDLRVFAEQRGVRDAFEAFLEAGEESGLKLCIHSRAAVLSAGGMGRPLLLTFLLRHSSSDQLVVAFHRDRAIGFFGTEDQASYIFGDMATGNCSLTRQAFDQMIERLAAAKTATVGNAE